MVEALTGIPAERIEQGRLEEHEVEEFNRILRTLFPRNSQPLLDVYARTDLALEQERGLVEQAAVLGPYELIVIDGRTHMDDGAKTGLIETIQRATREYMEVLLQAVPPGLARLTCYGLAVEARHRALKAIEECQGVAVDSNVPASSTVYGLWRHGAQLRFTLLDGSTVGSAEIFDIAEPTVQLRGTGRWAIYTHVEMEYTDV